MDPGSPCPCGTHMALAACCAPLLNGARQAATPQELMRSRYSAYATGDADYLFRTWHPRTRPAEVDLDQWLRWRELEILEVEGDEVEFIARFEAPSGADGAWGGTWEADEVHERSHFEQRAGRWFYVGPVPTKVTAG